jgi:hypothetical protein
MLIHNHNVIHQHWAQDTERTQTKQKTQHRKLKRWAKWTPTKTYLLRIHYIDSYLYVWLEYFSFKICILCWSTRLAVSLDCSFLIVLSVFSNFYLFLIFALDKHRYRPLSTDMIVDALRHYPPSIVDGLPACILHEYNELWYWLQPILPFPMYKR